MKSFLVLGALVLSATTATASTFVVTETRSRYVACYNNEYVPAKVLVNTKGKLVRGEQHSWEISPAKWNRVREPAVYVQTRRTIENDHYTLVAASCPN